MIKTIVIDLGGVYFTPGTKIAVKKIRKITNAPKQKIDEIFEGYPKKEGWLYRRGKITKKAFWNAAIKKLKIDRRLVPKIQEIWHSSYKPIKGIRKLVQKLRKRYRVIAFSGSIRERVDYLNKRYGLKQDFDDLILSFNFGFTKKEIEFYKILISRIRCKPEECLIIDDSPFVLEIAKSFKIKTILFKNLKQLKLDLKKIGVI